DEGPRGPGGHRAGAGRRGAVPRRARGPCGGARHHGPGLLHGRRRTGRHPALVPHGGRVRRRLPQRDPGTDLHRGDVQRPPAAVPPRPIARERRGRGCHGLAVREPRPVHDPAERAPGRSARTRADVPRGPGPGPHHLRRAGVRPQRAQRVPAGPRAPRAADRAARAGAGMSTSTGSLPRLRADFPASAAAADRPDAGTAPPTRRDPLRLAAQLSPLLGLGVSIALVWWGLETGVLQSLENLQVFIDSLGAWGPVAFLIASAASVVFPIVPAGLLVIAGPVLFGPIEGTIYNYVAVCAGSLLNFAIARHVGLGLIERLFRPRTVEKFLGWTRSGHFARAFAVAIALPIAPDDLLCYIAGTTRMRWRTYVAIILLCKPWALIAYGLGVSALVLRFLPW